MLCCLQIWKKNTFYTFCTSLEKAILQNWLRTVSKNQNALIGTPKMAWNHHKNRLTSSWARSWPSDWARTWLSKWQKIRPEPGLMACIYIYIYMLWYYYLGQVWPFEVLLSGPSLLFYKTLFVKKHYNNRGVNTFCEKEIARANLRCYYLGQVGHF